MAIEKACSNYVGLVGELREDTHTQVLLLELNYSTLLQELHCLYSIGYQLRNTNRRKLRSVSCWVNNMIM